MKIDKPLLSAWYVEDGGLFAFDRVFNLILCGYPVVIEYKSYDEFRAND